MLCMSPFSVGTISQLHGSDAVINIEGPVTMTNNEARYRGGAIWNAGNVKIPQDADISGNTAPTVSSCTVSCAVPCSLARIRVIFPSNLVNFPHRESCMCN